MMIYKFLWVEGNLKVWSGASRKHHFQALKDMINEGLVDAGSMPQDYVGGVYSEEKFHGPEYDEVSIDWAGGTHPNAVELRYIVGKEIGRFGDRETEYRTAAQMQRMFISFELPENAAQQVIQWQAENAPTEYEGNFYLQGPDKLHMTLAFLGDTPVEHIPELQRIIQGLDHSIVRLTGPIEYRELPQLAFLVFAEENGQALVTQLNEQLEAATGWKAQYKVWLPHITVWRYTDPLGLNPPLPHVEFYPSEIALFASSTDGYTKLTATSEDTEPEGANVGFMRDPHPTLYPPAFGESERMDDSVVAKLKAHVLNAIEAEYKDPDQFIYFTVFGSGASYNWDEAGDFDIQMWCDHTKFLAQHPGEPLDQDDMIADIRRIIHPINFPSFADLELTGPDGEGKMLIQYYAKPGTGSEEENLASKPYACYDMETNDWLVKPDPIRPTFYGEAFGLVKPKAEEIAIQAEGLIGELQRHTLNWQFWYGMHRRYRNHKYKAEFEESQDKATQLKEGVVALFKGVFKGRQEAYSEEGKGFQDERDFLQKLLEIWGAFQKLKHYAREPLPWEAQELPAEEESKSDEAETNEKSSRSIHAWSISQPGWSVKIHKIAEWSDIQEKARRYMNEGRVTLVRNSPTNTVSQVTSENEEGQVYDTEIWRDDPNNPNVISLWNCSCPWGDKSWGRTRKWKKYEGRPCAHTLATNWVSQTEPYDEEAEMEQGQLPGQDWQLLEEQVGPGMDQTWEQFVAPTAPVPGGPNMPAPQPAAPPPAPAAPPPRPPSHLKGPNELQTTLDMPGTFSRVASFNNGDKVRTRKPQTGLDRDNYERVIPINSAGEVLWSDEEETIVIFPLNTGELEPHLVKVVDATKNFYAAPNMQPFVKKRSNDEDEVWPFLYFAHEDRIEFGQKNMEHDTVPTYRSIRFADLDEADAWEAKIVWGHLFGDGEVRLYEAEEKLDDDAVEAVEQLAREHLNELR